MKMKSINGKLWSCERGWRCRFLLIQTKNPSSEPDFKVIAYNWFLKEHFTVCVLLYLPHHSVISHLKSSTLVFRRSSLWVCLTVVDFFLFLTWQSVTQQISALQHMPRFTPPTLQPQQSRHSLFPPPATSKDNLEVGSQWGTISSEETNSRFLLLVSPWLCISRQNGHICSCLIFFI